MGFLHKILSKPGSAPTSSQKFVDLKLFILGLQYTGQGLDARHQVEHEVLQTDMELPSDPRKLMIRMRDGDVQRKACRGQNTLKKVMALGSG